MCSSTMLCAHSPIALWNSTSIAASSSKSPRACAACMRAMISVEQRAVVVGGAPRRKFGGDALDRAAILQIVGRRLAVRDDQLHHRLGENLADHVGDIGAAAMPRDDQAALLQHLQRVAQDRPRHVELARQLALGRQPVGDPQHALRG